MRRFFLPTVLLVITPSQSDVLNLTGADVDVLVPVVGVLEAVMEVSIIIKNDVKGVVP